MGSAHKLRSSWNMVRSTQYLVLGTLLLPGIAIPAGAADPTATFLGRKPDEWLARLDSDQPPVRAEAAWALAQVSHDDLYYVGRLFRHADHTVAYWSVHGLQRLVQSKKASEEVRESAREVLRAALTSEVPCIRIAAAEALGITGESKQAIPVLIKAMSDPQDAVRIQAIAALEKLGEAARPGEATLRAATTDSSQYVKRIGARALIKLDATKK